LKTLNDYHHFNIRLFIEILLATTLWQNYSKAQNADSNSGRINLAGKWGFKIDSIGTIQGLFINNN
jgi:hypothetical protein